MKDPTRRRDPLGIACGLAAAAVVAAFLLLAAFLLGEARSVANPGFLLDTPSRLADRAGVGPALAGTLWLALITAALALPVGVGTAIYLEEYAPRNRMTAWGGSALASLAGVPSVVYGVAGLALFVRGLGMGPGILAGGCTLAALALPTVIVTSRASIRSVPEGVRLAAYSLGATRWQVVRGEVLPAAAPGILAGNCLALTRTIGEAAPLLVLGAVSFMTFAPRGPGDPLTSLPTRIFTWTTRSEQDFTALAAGAGVALLLVLLAMNLAALALRRRMRGASR